MITKRLSTRRDPVTGARILRASWSLFGLVPLFLCDVLYDA